MQKNAQLKHSCAEITQKNAQLEHSCAELMQKNAQLEHSCAQLEATNAHLMQKNKELIQAQNALSIQAQNNIPDTSTTNTNSQITQLELMLDAATKFKQKLAHSFPESSSLLLQDEDLFIERILGTCKSLLGHFEQALMQMYSQIPTAPPIIRLPTNCSLLLQNASLDECKAYVDSVVESTLKALTSTFQQQSDALQSTRSSLCRLESENATQVAELNAKLQFYAAKIAKYRGILHKKEHFIVKALEQLEILSTYGAVGPSTLSESVAIC